MLHCEEKLFKYWNSNDYEQADSYYNSIVTEEMLEAERSKKRYHETIEWLRRKRARLVQVLFLFDYGKNSAPKEIGIVFHLATLMKKMEKG